MPVQIDVHRQLPSRMVHELIEEQAARSPEVVALVFEDQQLTYRQLNERANQLAHHLQGLGVGPETLVGVCMERSLELVVGLLAILKAGGAYVPMDPTYPQERLAFMLDDAAVRVLITQSWLRDRLPRHEATCVCLDDNSVELAAQDTSHPEPALTADNLAYVIYTSGSTGRPKGAMNTHGGLLNRLAWMQDAYRLTEDDRVLQKTPISFDVSVWEFFWPLMYGARLVMARPEGHKDPAYLVEAITKDQITTLHFVPSMLHVFLEADGVEACTSLKRVICSGEALSVELQNRFFARTGAELHNLYGPTEAAIDVTYWACQRDSSLTTVPIGRPIWNTYVFILDTHMQPVPMGAAGELHLGGVGLARGYLHRPELTAERFVADPFSDDPQARLYKTGDLVRYLPDGNIEYLGRLDDQVKIRGFRIELGEIEATLGRHPGVRQTVVVAREDNPGDKRLVAYLVAADPAAHPGNEALRDFLKSRLPEYMVPSAFVTLPSMPLNPNGKIDRKALPTPGTHRPQLQHACVAPRDAVEEQLADIWQTILGLQPVGVHDNFFELGGHSLLATQVVSRVRSHLNANVQLGRFFASPTIAGLADQIRATQAESRSSAPSMATVSRDQPWPLSFAQQRLWFLDQYASNRAVYNEPLAVHLDGPLEVTLLQRSLQEIVRRHEVLRTTFQAVDGEPVQVIAASTEVDLPLAELQDLPAAQRAHRVEELASAEACRPFDLQCGPLVRAQLLRLDTTEHVLLLCAHHIVCDGWSMGLLFDELKAVYRSRREGGPAEVPDLPVQYVDYTAWQRQWLQGEVLEGQLAYWKQQLAGAPSVLELPTDRPRPELQSYRGACETVVWPRELTAALSALGQSEGATLFMILLAGFQVLLHRYSGQSDLMVGSPIAGRNRAEVESLIGFFVNTLALRTDLSGNPTVRELLGRVRQVCLGAYDHQDLPFEKLVEELKPTRSLSYSPLFQVMLVLHNAPPSRVELPDLQMRAESVHNGTAKFDLVLQVEPTSAHLQLALEYSTDLFDATTAQRMLGHLRQLLEGMVQDPAQPIGQLPMLTAPERHQLLEAWNDTRRELPAGAVHELFEEQAARSPEAVALVFEDQQLTYRQLNERANQLAHYLQGLSFGHETLVGICMERSQDLVVGLLAILKAGGAYVPLDPTYPRERLAFMLEDTAAAVILTHRRLAGGLPSGSGRVVCVDEEAAQIASESTEPPVCVAGPESLAYVMYTSGSTGQPKGVEVVHRGVVRLVQNTNYCTFGPDEVFLQLAPICFDASTFEIWGPLLNGGRLVLYPNEQPSLDQLGAVLRQYGVTTLWLTAGLFHVMVDERVEDLGPLRQLLAGGDVLSPKHVRRCLEINPQLRLINGYGPTENTTFTCCHLLTPADSVPENVPIGRPIANTQVYLLDAQLNPVPVGARGELYTGGEGLARGYHRRPELTAERFVPDPFNGRSGARLYRTGDQARYLPDGTIEFLGRRDGQVKIRGFRIELGEIEAAIAQHPQVRQNAVVARADAAGDKQLIAYLVAGDSEAPPTADALRDFLKSRLPEYMVPSAFVTLPSMPLNPNGKIDRRALLAVEAGSAESIPCYVAPRNATEQALVGIWTDLLGKKAIGVQDDFFLSGGHSLLAVRLMARIQARFGRALPLSVLYKDTTVEALARVLTQDQDVQVPGVLVPLNPAGRGTPLFIFPGAGGHVFTFRELARILDADCPVYGLQSVGVDGKEPMLDRIPDLAERYLQEITGVQTTGPYRLAGYSAGGFVAYEVADRLRARGETVSFLGIIDCYAPGYPRPLRIRERIQLHRRNLRQLTWAQKVVWFREHAMNRVMKMGLRLGLVSVKPPPEEAHASARLARQCEDALRRAMDAYRPPRFNGDMVVFRAMDTPDWMEPVLDDPALGWGKWAGGQVEHHGVPGTHLELFDAQNVSHLAAIMRQCLAASAKGSAHAAY